jgi:hypothetical protein
MKPSVIIRNVALSGAMVVGLFFLALPGIPHLPFFYDEADYVYASHQGWFANWVDRPALNVIEFVRLGVGSGRDSSHRVDLSEYIRNSGDIHFYRHWHGPLFYQWLGFIGHWTSGEYELRLVSMLIPAAGALVVYFGCLWVLPSSPVIAILSAAFYTAGYSVIGSPELAPHQLFVVVSLANLFCLAKFEASRAVKWWWWSCFWTAISFATLEVAFVNIGVALLIGWRCRSDLRAVRRVWLRSLGLFLMVSLIVWPAGIFKLEPLRSYMFMAYLAVFRKGAWGTTTIPDAWLFRFLSEPVEWFLVLVALIVWWFLPHKAERRVAFPFVAYGMTMLVVMFKVNALMPHYVLPYLAPLTVFAGITLGAGLKYLPKPAQPALAALLVLLVVAGTHRYVATHVPAETSRTLQILEATKSSALEGKSLLAPQVDVSVLHYYFPQTKLVLYSDENGKRRALSERRVDAILSDETEPVHIEYLGGLRN